MTLILILSILNPGNGIMLTSIPPLASLVSLVSGERFDVRSLLSGRENPHTYEPSPKDALLVNRALIFITNGLGIDEWTYRFEKKNVFVLGDTLLSRNYKISNPHIWLDLTLTKKILFLIADLLSRKKPEYADEFYTNACRASFRLDSLVKWGKKVVQKIENRKLLAFHPAWNALLEYIGFEIVDVVVERPEKEPSLKRIREIIKKCRDEKVKVVLIEEGFPSKIPEEIAKEIPAKGAIVNPLISGDYINGLRNNILSIVNAFEE